MYFRENDKIVEHYSNEGLEENNKFPWWLLVIIIIVIVVLACCFITWMKSSKVRSQNFGFKFF